LDNNVEEMFIGPFGSSLKNECFVPREEGFCIVYEQKHAIQKTMDLDARYVTEKKYKELQRFNVIGGDIIVSCRGTIGEIYPVPDDAPLGIMHPSIMKIRLKKEKYDKDFFAFALERYMKEHMSEANGTAVKMAVSAKALGKEHFIIPDLRTQQAFVAFVKQSDKSKFELQQSITRIDNLIKSLIQGTEN
jgi:type I restriction enzyme S subunit